jgi:hypothetical protein
MFLTMDFHALTDQQCKILETATPYAISICRRNKPAQKGVSEDEV